MCRFSETISHPRGNTSRSSASSSQSTAHTRDVANGCFWSQEVPKDVTSFFPQFFHSQIYQLHIQMQADQHGGS